MTRGLEWALKVASRYTHARRATAAVVLDRESRIGVSAAEASPSGQRAVCYVRADGAVEPVGSEGGDVCLTEGTLWTGPARFCAPGSAE